VEDADLSGGVCICDACGRHARRILAVPRMQHIFRRQRLRHRAGSRMPPWPDPVPSACASMPRVDASGYAGLIPLARLAEGLLRDRDRHPPVRLDPAPDCYPVNAERHAIGILITIPSVGTRTIVRLFSWLDTGSVSHWLPSTLPPAMMTVPSGGGSTYPVAGRT